MSKITIHSGARSERARFFILVLLLTLLNFGHGSSYQSADDRIISYQPHSSDVTSLTQESSHNIWLQENVTTQNLRGSEIQRQRMLGLFLDTPPNEWNANQYATTVVLVLFLVFFCLCLCSSCEIIRDLICVWLCCEICLD